MKRIILFIVCLSLVIVGQAIHNQTSYFMVAPSGNNLHRIINHKITDAPGYSSLEEELEHCKSMKLAWHKAVEAMPKGSVEQRVLYTYTIFNYELGPDRDQFYKILNTRIRDWFKQPGSFFEFKHFVNVLMKQAAHHPKPVTLYRGASHDQRLMASSGSLLLTSQFESTSLDKEQTEFFVKNGMTNDHSWDMFLGVEENFNLFKVISRKVFPNDFSAFF